jgi:hypothetical protein
MSDIIAAKAMNRWWEKKKEPLSVWQACKDAEGLEYYYNAETKETTWEKPKELMSADELDSQVCYLCRIHRSFLVVVDVFFYDVKPSLSVVVADFMLRVVPATVCASALAAAASVARASGTGCPTTRSASWRPRSSPPTKSPRPS